MERELLDIMQTEFSALKQLLSLLEKQFSFVLKKDIFSLEKVVEDIKLANKAVAEAEVKRRRITEGQSMSALVKSFNNEELKDVYRNIVNLLEEVRLQKESNELLLKQNLTFTNKILSYINPNRNVVTYDSYGKSKR